MVVSSYARLSGLADRECHRTFPGQGGPACGGRSNTDSLRVLMMDALWKGSSRDLCSKDRQDP